MDVLSPSSKIILSLEQRRFAQLEPLLLGEDQAFWDEGAKTIARTFQSHTVALVMLSSRFQHTLLGSFGIATELELVQAISAEISPAKTILTRGESILLNYEEAQQSGLTCWLRVSRSRGLAVAPLWIDHLLVGALVLGTPEERVPATWDLDTLDRVALEISALLRRSSEERLRERTSGLTVVDPGAARIALRGALRRTEQILQHLTMLNSRIWRSFALHSEEDILAYGPSLSKAYTEALGSYENLVHRLKMLIDWSSPERSDLAQQQVLTLAQGLLGMRSLQLLSKAIGQGRISFDQGSQALRMLGTQSPDDLQMALTVRDLLAWLEKNPSSIRSQIYNRR